MQWFCSCLSFNRCDSVAIQLRGYACGSRELISLPDKSGAVLAIKRLIAGLLMLAATSWCAVAEEGRRETAPQAMAPAPSWTGVYAGGHFGWAWGHSDWIA